MDQIVLNCTEGNCINVEITPEGVELFAEWAGDIYGEGYLTLSKSQAIQLAKEIITHWGL